MRTPGEITYQINHIEIPKLWEHKLLVGKSEKTCDITNKEMKQIKLLKLYIYIYMGKLHFKLYSFEGVTLKP